jgi:PAS domain S-box-containing protein
MSSRGLVRRSRSRRVTAVAVSVFLVLATAAVAAFGITRNVASDNERRLLTERAREVAALLQNAVGSSTSALTVLAVLATSQDKAGFDQGARALVRSPGSAASALTESAGGFTVTASVGGAAVVGQPASPDRAALAVRALAVRQPVADLVRDGDRTKLAFAVAAPDPARVVALSESPIDPTRPTPQSPGSPFTEMRGTLYASPQPDPARVILTTETDAEIPGRAVAVPFEIGAEKWTLVVSAREPLSGSFPGRASWILLGAGLVAALLASAVVQTLARRQQFANTLVQERTAELEATREFLERLLVSGPTVVVRADLTESSRRISYVSPNVERIFGLKPGDILEAGTLLANIHPDDVATAGAILERLRENGRGGETFEFRMRHGDGSWRWASSISVPDIDERGTTTGVFAYLTDITTRREAEEALRGARHAAEAANRSKSEFLSRMSHELRTPLNAVIGFGQLLEGQHLSEEQAEAVDHILKGGRHLLDLINEVLDISRIESGRLLLSPEPVHIAELVRESLDLVRSLAERRQITLIAEESGMDTHMYADRQRLKQVLLNLLSNAIKYNRFRGTVVVSCAEVPGTRLRLSVHDTGPGIRPEQMDRLFTPFDRLDAGRTEVEGTGIGLTLSKNLAEAMGGALVVESTVGQGSTFSVELPLVEGQVERFERSRRAPAMPPQPVERDGQPPGDRQTVLYIEDNLSNLKLIERILARRGDVDVVSAMQGRLGVELARQHQPTMILLDLHLPDVNGEEILRRLREDPLTSAIPVVIVTADATAGQVQRLLSAGAAAYLTKPLDVAKLLSVIDDVLPVG